MILSLLGVKHAIEGESYWCYHANAFMLIMANVDFAASIASIAMTSKIAMQSIAIAL